MKNQPILILAGIVFVICVGAFWFLKSSPPVTVPHVSPPIAAPSRSFEQSVPISRPLAGPTPVTPEEVTKAPRPAPAWEAKIEQLLSSNLGEAQTARLLINLMPTLPPEGQAEAAQHISNLLLDKDYNLILPLVKNPSLPEEVLDVFVTDLMNREDVVKLPTLLEIARLPNHPHHEEALSDLQIFLDEEHGTDWNKWNAAVTSYLKKQQVEDAAISQPAAPGARPAGR